jgi:hypothetical protein
MLSAKNIIIEKKIQVILNKNIIPKVNDRNVFNDV